MTTELFALQRVRALDSPTLDSDTSIDLACLRQWVEHVARQWAHQWRVPYQDQWLWAAHDKLVELADAYSLAWYEFPSYCLAALVLVILERTRIVADFLPVRTPWSLYSTRKLRRCWRRLCLHRHPRCLAPLRRVRRLPVTTARLIVYASPSARVVEKLFDWTERWEMVRESQALLELCHPHVVPYLGYRSHSLSVGLVMPLARWSLGQLLRRASRSPTKRALVARWRWLWLEQLLAAVGYAHSRGVAHRDIKPDNILIRGDGHLWLTDWGLSFHWHHDQQLEVMAHPICTSCTRAPEAFESARYNPFGLDVWSVGVVGLALFTQQIFDETDERKCRAQMAALLQDDPTWPPDWRPLAEGFFRPVDRRLTVQQCWERLQAVRHEQFS